LKVKEISIYYFDCGLFEEFADALADSDNCDPGAEKESLCFAVAIGSMDCDHFDEPIEEDYELMVTSPLHINNQHYIIHLRSTFFLSPDCGIFDAFLSLISCL